MTAVNMRDNLHGAVIVALIVVVVLSVAVRIARHVCVPKVGVFVVVGGVVRGGSSVGVNVTESSVNVGLVVWVAFLEHTVTGD